MAEVSNRLNDSNCNTEVVKRNIMAYKVFISYSTMDIPNVGRCDDSCNSQMSNVSYPNTP